MLLSYKRHVPIQAVRGRCGIDRPRGNALFRYPTRRVGAGIESAYIAGVRPAEQQRLARPSREAGAAGRRGPGTTRSVGQKADPSRADRFSEPEVCVVGKEAAAGLAGAANIRRERRLGSSHRDGEQQSKAHRVHVEPSPWQLPQSALYPNSGRDERVG